ncbi:hypothetical protein ACL9RL_06480 [Plantibacter sp. Mn2098]|uniref:hypothetical protein n=1 Tax=Plantibacter sp. Mn2098 TaxID=3395266 RepID=UPI003BE2A792
MFNTNTGEGDMGILDDAKDALKATGEKIGDAVEDAKERIEDKVDEAKADAKVKQAETERDATKAKNDYKEQLRD